MIRINIGMFCFVFGLAMTTSLYVLEYSSWYTGTFGYDTYCYTVLPFAISLLLICRK